MIDKRVQMMDAGMALFQTAKPFGTVLGGIKAEMERHGKVLRRNELKAEDLPEGTGDCDLVLDWSSWLRKRLIACVLEEAGEAGKTSDGETIHRYAASFKEGNKNTVARVVICCLKAAVFIALGIIGIRPVPRAVTILAGLAIAVYIFIIGLKPSVKAQRLTRRLEDNLRHSA